MFKIDYYCFSVAHLIGARSFSTFKSLFLYSSASVSHFLPLVVMSTFSHCSTNLCHAIFIYFSRSNAPLSHPHVITIHSISIVSTKSHHFLGPFSIVGLQCIRTRRSLRTKEVKKAILIGIVLPNLEKEFVVCVHNFQSSSKLSLN